MDFSLTEEQLELRELTRKFAQDELVPASMTLDAEVDPRRCFSPDLVRRASELGLRTLKIPRELGGLGSNCLTEVVVLEELCAGDVGFGMSIQHPWREGYALAAHTTPEQRERHLPGFLADPTYLTSLAITEDHFGSDSSGSSDDPADGPRTTAVRDGDGWRVDGAKRWITNGNVASIVLLLARTDPTVPWRQGCTLFLLPTDAPGFRVGRIEDKLGIRLNQNAEIIMEGCRLPADAVLGEPGAGMTMLSRISAGSRAKTATKALGIARAAYEEAAAYAAERVQGGRPLGQHQLVAAALAEMEGAIEATRTLVWRAAWCVDERRPEASRLESHAKAIASETAAAVATSALEIHGSYGVQRGRRMEKLVRDAQSILHTGVGNAVLRARLGASLGSDAVRPAAVHHGL